MYTRAYLLPCFFPPLFFTSSIRSFASKPTRDMVLKEGSTLADSLLLHPCSS